MAEVILAVQKPIVRQLVKGDIRYSIHSRSNDLHPGDIVVFYVGRPDSQAFAVGIVESTQNLATHIAWRVYGSDKSGAGYRSQAAFMDKFGQGASVQVITYAKVLPLQYPVYAQQLKAIVPKFSKPRYVYRLDREMLQRIVPENILNALRDSDTSIHLKCDYDGIRRYFEELSRRVRDDAEVFRIAGATNITTKLLALAELMEEKSSGVADCAKQIENVAKTYDIRPAISNGKVPNAATLIERALWASHRGQAFLNAGAGCRAKRVLQELEIFVDKYA